MPTGAGDRYRAFRGRWTTPVAYVLALSLVVGSTVMAMAARGLGTDPVNRASFIVFGLACAVVAWRFGAVRAVPDQRGLTVINYVRRRRLAWAEIVSVRFGSGDPWVHLDLADGSVLAVMGIQRSDGEHGMAEARRLAELVSEHGEAPEPEL
ncbi:PH domain-containing protein [Antribacter gilvus]|uniref:PH domain-containing protein n=1 Tax=Antribacter gilvus TaxID=2304675 RepID=UPI001F0CAF6C|nr:PH domain-containing protein [Antribacter gilvus]